MPQDFMVRTGDQAIFNPSFPPATVSVLPGTITGTGRVVLEGAVACVLGDEASVVVPGVLYIGAAFPIPGVGTLTISALNADQIATRTRAVQKSAILKGTQFTALFTVNVPATVATPGGPVPDPVPFYNGTGYFMSANFRVKGT